MYWGILVSMFVFARSALILMYDLRYPTLVTALWARAAAEVTECRWLLFHGYDRLVFVQVTTDFNRQLDNTLGLTDQHGQ
jgi:hypothetical protein